MSDNASSGWGFWDTIKATSAQIESTAKSYLAEVPDNEQIKSQLAAWGSTAGKYLDAADERIGEFESNANNYLKGLSGEIKSFIAHSGDPEGPNTSTDLFNADVVPNRLEQDLKALHTNAELFVGDLSDKDPSVSATELLEKYPDLQTLHSQLVPSKLTSNQFWNKYEELRAPILAKDEKRKQILNQQQNQDDDEGWGSSDDN